VSEEEEDRGSGRPGIVGEGRRMGEGTRTDWGGVGSGIWVVVWAISLVDFDEEMVEGGGIREDIV
jgi:hypothetical protein